MTANVSHIFENARVAARKLNLVDTETIDKILLAVADEAEKEVDYILQENCRDLALMPKTDPKYDRLMLSRERILGITADMRKVAGLPSPLGRILASFDRPNGMRIEKVSVPFGVIGIIYEARPNVTFDVFSLCLKSGNVCILKGGSDAQYSNNAIINIINKVLISYGIDSNTAILLPNDHSFTDKLLTAVGQVDLIIPRGSGRLINYVREHALVPVIETGAGICHTYFDSDGDLEKGRNIVFNAKTRRVSVCNALDCLIIHKQYPLYVPKGFLPRCRIWTKYNMVPQKKIGFAIFSGHKNPPARCGQGDKSSLCKRCCQLTAGGRRRPEPCRARCPRTLRSS